MIAVVEQALGHIHRGDTCGLILQAVEHELMTAEAVDGQFVDILERLLDVVGIERGERTHQLQLLATQREDIGIGAHHHRIVALIRRHEGEELLQTLAHTDRTTARTATAMRRGERLVEIDVHHVEAHIAWAAGTEHGVQIGTIVIHQATAVVDETRYRGDARLEEAERIGIGHHHRCNLSTLLSDDALQILDIDGTVGLRLHLDDLESADGCRSGVRAMGRVGYDHLLTGHVATRTVIVVDRHQSRQLTMGACIGLEGEMSQTREGTERLLQKDDEGTCACHRGFGLQGVQVLELGQRGHLLVDLRIVLHRTGAEGIEARIDTEVIVGEVRIVAHHRQLVALRQCCLFLAAEFLWYLVIAKAVSGQTVALAALLRKFEDQISI